jgi:hypothetical protein
LGIARERERRALDEVDPAHIVWLDLKAVQETQQLIAGSEEPRMGMRRSGLGAFRF